MTLIDSMTKIFPVTVTKLSDPVTKAMKNISRALYGLPAPNLSSTGEQDAESLVDTLHVVLANRSADWLTDEPEARKRDTRGQTKDNGSNHFHDSLGL